MREKLNNKRGIAENNEEEQWERKGKNMEKEWKKEDKIVFVRKCKIWRNQYKETKERSRAKEKATQKQK